MKREVKKRESVFNKLVKDEYTRLFFQHWKRVEKIQKDLERLKDERTKLLALMRATYNMMPDTDRAIFAKAADVWNNEALGLTAAIREVLQSDTNNYFTPIEIKDALIQIGFDFSGYTSNPLSSVHAVLKRFNRSEVKVRKQLDGKTIYQWKVLKAELPEKEVTEAAEAIVRTVNKFGSAIAAEFPNAADSDLMGNLPERVLRIKQDEK